MIKTKKALDEPFNTLIIVFIIAIITIILIVAFIKTGVIKYQGTFAEHIFKPAGME